MWEAEGPDSRGLLVSGGKLYLGSPLEGVRCLDARSGTVVWDTAPSERGVAWPDLEERRIRGYAHRRPLRATAADLPRQD